jgi:outer membrane PBP1 activator LpoA protein
MPWILDSNGGHQYLQSSIKDYWPDSAARYGRFHALGIDAWRVIPYLDQLENNLMGAYQGVTGNLTLDSNRQLHRGLDWARFQQGIPERLPLHEVMESPLAAIP